MTSQPINPTKPYQKVEVLTLNKVAKFLHYTPNNKKVMGGSLCASPPGCNKPKKPGLDRVKIQNCYGLEAFRCVANPSKTLWISLLSQASVFLPGSPKNALHGTSTSINSSEDYMYIQRL